MNLPKGWRQETPTTYRWSSDEMEIGLVTSDSDDAGWRFIGHGATLDEATTERLLWSLEPQPDREGLARALYEAGSKALVALPWVNIPRPVVEAWLSVADTAIRLCGGVREEVPEGWPEGWTETYEQDCRVYDPGPHVTYEFRLPNTEPGRAAAWKLEGKDAEPREPLSITADRIAKEASNLREELARARAETRAAIESRDQADQEAAALRDLLKKANEEIEEYKTRNRTLTDRLKFVESNLQQVHHDRDTQRAIVDHLRDMIVDIARGRQ